MSFVACTCQGATIEGCLVHGAYPNYGSQIWYLRERTGCGLQDARKMLERAGGDAERAIEGLTKIGQAVVRPKQWFDDCKNKIANDPQCFDDGCAHCARRRDRARKPRDESLQDAVAPLRRGKWIAAALAGYGIEEALGEATFERLRAKIEERGNWAVDDAVEATAKHLRRTT